MKTTFTKPWPDGTRPLISLFADDADLFRDNLLQNAGVFFCYVIKRNRKGGEVHFGTALLQIIVMVFQPLPRAQNDYGQPAETASCLAIFGTDDIIPAQNLTMVNFNPGFADYCQSMFAQVLISP